MTGPMYNPHESQTSLHNPFYYQPISLDFRYCPECEGTGKIGYCTCGEPLKAANDGYTCPDCGHHATQAECETCEGTGKLYE